MVGDRHLVQGDAVAQQGFRLIQLLGCAGEGHQVDPGRHEVGIHPQGLAILVHRLLLAPLAREQHRQIEAPARQIRIATRAPLIVGKLALESCPLGLGQALRRYVGESPDGLVPHRQGRVPQ
ncbi:hypothetical protein D3C79_859520 [compost metagenome]